MSTATIPSATGPEHRLAAIVFTDVVGYSARMQRQELATLALVKADFTHIRGLCTENGGEVLNTMGDGMLMCFPSAFQAVTCALRIQDEFGRRAAQVTAEEALVHRIGIHVGDVVRENGGIAGDGVNIAARLQTKAPPGGICVSQIVLDTVKQKLPLQAEFLGAQSFKNITEKIPVYSLTPAALPGAAPAGPSRWRRSLALGAIVVVAAGMIFWRLHTGNNATARHSAGPAPVTTVAENAAALVQRANEITRGLGTFTRDNLVLAEQLAGKAVELDPSSAMALAALAQINLQYYIRGYETTAARIAAARRLANQAMTQAPEQAEALLTLGQIAALQQSDWAGAEAFYRRALRSAPDDNRIRRAYGGLLSFQRRNLEAQTLLKDAIRIDPSDPLMRYELTAIYVRGWDFPSAWKEVQTMLELQSFGSGWTLKAIICAQWKGDLQGMREALDRLAPVDRAEDRPVYLLMWCALAERKPALALEAAKLTPRDYLEDNYFTGPKAWLTARAHTLSGHEHLAEADYRAAETVIRARLKGSPENPDDKLDLAITLAWLGRMDEAKQEGAPLEAVAREQSPAIQAPRLAQLYAALGDAKRAVAYLRQIDSDWGGFKSFTPAILRLDPWWDKIRDQPEFEALLNDPTYCPRVR